MITRDEPKMKVDRARVPLCQALLELDDSCRSETTARKENNSTLEVVIWQENTIIKCVQSYNYNKHRYLFSSDDNISFWMHAIHVTS